MTDVFAESLRMGESPRWHDGRFWMCDWLAGEVLTTTPDGVRVGTDLAAYGPPPGRSPPTAT